MKKQLSMISLFESFITDTAKGKRRKLNMQKLKPGSFVNYGYTLKPQRRGACPPADRDLFYKQ